MTEFILVFALLSTESSYKADIERPSTGVADTAQFWFGASGPWRIRTYAIDHDIHVYALKGSSDKPTHQVGDAEAHLRKHYGDVLKKIEILRFKDPRNQAEVARVLAAHGLSGTLEVASAGFGFYNPDRGKYKTQSQPK